MAESNTTMEGSPAENTQIKHDMNVIKTRAETYQRIINDPNKQPKNSLAGSPILNIKTRKMNFIKCKDHFFEDSKDNWSSENTRCKLCVKFVLLDDPKSGFLPRNIDVLNMILTKEKTTKTAIRIHEVAELISVQWISCNVYPKSLSSVVRHCEDLFDTYSGLKKVFKQNRHILEKMHTLSNEFK